MTASSAASMPSSSFDSQQFTENMEKISHLWPEIMALLMQSMPQPKPTDQRVMAHLQEAFVTCYQTLMQKDPVNLLEWQMNWWQQSVSLWQQQWGKFMEAPVANAEEQNLSASKDRRFRNELWENSWVFDTLRKQYLLNVQSVEHAVQDVSGSLDAHTAHLVTFYSKQWMDALSPSNFPWSNPEVLKLTLESNGDNLVQGMQNLLADLQAGRISMTTPQSFELGRNLATTKGSVVFENEIFQLIQYEPLTTEVYATPLLIIPAWINKYYILDLQPENSLAKWLLEQGFSVFVVSWVNPKGAEHNFSFDDYLERGAYAALKAVQDATGEESVNICGYCLGGTLTSCLLSWLQSRGEASRVKTATFLTTLVDFSEAGDLRVFIDEPQIEALEARMAEKGYLEGKEMAVTFNMLRPVDLIWSFVVNNYLLGKSPFPFDLLYWNMDATAMPATMHSYYLRQMYLYNNLIVPKKLKLAGQEIDLTTITTPAYLLATREDHIAPWLSAYKMTHHLRGEKCFVLAESGHIAGVINPPGRNKYGYWSNESIPVDPQVWIDTATKQQCSWWPHWANWVQTRCPEKVPARKIVLGKFKELEPAPGRYAKA
jgi:polyhydroxyalkanoate synthase